MKTPKHGKDMSVSPQKISKRLSKTQVARFFDDGLKEIYSTEQYLSGMLRRFQMAAITPVVKTLLNNQVAQTLGQVKRLEEIFQLVGKEPEKSEAIASLVTESDIQVGTTASHSADRDTAIIMAMKKLEQLEVAVYDRMVQLAKAMALDDVIDLLGKTLLEKKETESTLQLLPGVADH